MEYATFLVGTNTPTKAHEALFKKNMEKHWMTSIQLDLTIISRMTCRPVLFISSGMG